MYKIKLFNVFLGKEKENIKFYMYNKKPKACVCR